MASFPETYNDPFWIAYSYKVDIPESFILLSFTSNVNKVISYWGLSPLPLAK